MKKVTFLGSKKIGWECLQYINDHKRDLGIELIQLGTKLSKKDEYKERFIQLSQQEGISIFSDSDDVLLETDYIISVQFHLILSRSQLAKARHGAYNLHMAPLPEYRGCNQFSMAIIDQASVFGTTIHVMDAGIDHGDIVAESRFEIPQDIWVGDLYEMTEARSLQLFQSNLSPLLNGNLTPQSQESLIAERGTSLHYRDEINQLKELQLDWPEDKILRHIRATYMPGFEPPYFTIAGQKISVQPDE